MGPLGRHRHRWQVNIKMDLNEIVCEDVEWINVSQNIVQWRDFVNTVMNLQVHTVI